MLSKRSGYALELSFDEGLDARVRAVWSELAASGVDDFMSSLSAHPHISLVIYGSFTASANHAAEGAGVEEAIRRVAEFARSIPPLPVTLSSVGVFPGRAGVVFFGAVVTEELLRVHALSSELLADVGQNAWPYYCEGVWVPHCTLTQDMPEDRIPDAVEIAHRAPLPLRGTLTRANLVKFYPPEVIFSAPLSGPSDALP